MQGQSRILHGQHMDVSRNARARHEPIELPLEYLRYRIYRKSKLFTQVRYGSSAIFHDRRI
jgi:hypothetical protein